MSVSICKWVVETEREPVVCFFLLLFNRKINSVCCSIINLDGCIVVNGVALQSRLWQFSEHRCVFMKLLVQMPN